ncbi:MAG TPA: FkbM family methyltransferase [Solirubrobacteraceae bacterium]|jgi:FkbM family methyltransferase
MFINPVFDEPFETALLWRLLAPGMTFVDVGANRGWYTLLGAYRVGETGHILAFEPDTRAREVLAVNLRANPELQNRVHVFPTALSDHDGSAAFVLQPETALSHLQRRGDNPGPTTKVAVRTLCSILEETDHRTIGAVKIDVEGAELLVLRGLAPCLDSLQVTALLVEVVSEHLAKFDCTIQDVVQLLDATHVSYWVCWRHGRLEEATGPHCSDSGRNILALGRKDADAVRRRIIGP